MRQGDKTTPLEGLKTLSAQHQYCRYGFCTVYAEQIDQVNLNMFVTSKSAGQSFQVMISVFPFFCHATDTENLTSSWKTVK